MERDEIEKIIDGHITNLKLEVKSRFIHCFRDYPSGESTYGDKNNDMFAICQRGFGVPVLTFFSDLIAKHYRTSDELKELVSHEVLHVLGYGHGPIFYEKVKNNHLYA